MACMEAGISAFIFFPFKICMERFVNFSFDLKLNLLTHGVIEEVLFRLVALCGCCTSYHTWPSILWHDNVDIEAGSSQRLIMAVILELALPRATACKRNGHF